MIVDLEPLEGQTAYRNRFTQPGYLINFLSDRAKLMGIVAGGVMILVLLYLLLAPRAYTGKSMVLIDARKQEAVTNNPVMSGFEPDAPIVESELQMLTSRGLAEQVGKDLGLDRNAAFLAPSAGVLQFVKNIVSGGNAPDDPGRAMTDRLLGGLKANRVGTSYAIQISWKGDDPTLAARVANQYAKRYIINQIDVKDSATSEVNIKLRNRLGEIRQQLSQAEARLLAYKQRTGLVSAMDPANNSLAIAGLNEQLALSRAQAAEQQALLAAAQRQGGAAAPAAQASPAVQAIRAQSALVEAQAAQINARYGPDHPLVQQVNQQRSEINRLLNQEIGRSISAAREAARASATAAAQRAGSSQSSLSTVQGQFGANTAATARLAALEREVAGLAALYQSYLGRFNETGAGVGLQTPDARIISRAVPSLSASSPNIALTLALGILLAAFAAIGAAIIAELLLFLKLKRQENDVVA